MSSDEFDELTEAPHVSGSSSQCGDPDDWKAQLKGEILNGAPSAPRVAMPTQNIPPPSARAPEERRPDELPKAEVSNRQLQLPRETDADRLRLRWYLTKKGKWGDNNGDDFGLDPAVVFDHELRELDHVYWDDAPNHYPSLAGPDEGICHEDLSLAREILSIRDVAGLPVLEILGAEGIRRLGWQVSETSIGMVCWYQTIVPSGECVEDCDEPKCKHEKSKDPIVRRVPQLKLLCGTWGRYEKMVGAVPDEGGLGRHYEWVENSRMENADTGYVWHRHGVGACAWADLRNTGDGDRVLVTEGLKKGLVAYARGASVVVLGSVSQGGTGKLGRLKDIAAGGSGRYELAPEVLALLRNRGIVWAFDGDIVTKESVRRSLAGSMASAKQTLGAAPEFILFPVDETTKGALDSVLLANKGPDVAEVLQPFLVNLESVEELPNWLKGDRAADVVSIAWEWFQELYRRGQATLEPEEALQCWLKGLVDKERAATLMLPYDPEMLKIKRRDNLQAHLDERYLIVQLGEGASAVLERVGSRLVRPISADAEYQAVERTCFQWWKKELGREPKQTQFGEDQRRLRLRHQPQIVSPCSWLWDAGPTRWIMPEPRQGAFPTTERILARLRELDEDGNEIPLTSESRMATLALVGGIFSLETSRQVAVLRGEGGDGKGVLTRLVASAFGGLEGGNTVALAVADQTFNNSNRFWAEPLVGKYFCALMECKRARVMEDERMRTLTGGDSLPVEIKGGAQFNAPNHTRWWINSNLTMEITGQKADLSRVFPLLFVKREGEAVTDKAFQSGVLSEIREFMWACMGAYKTLCPSGGDVPLTAGLVNWGIGKNQGVTTGSVS